MAIKVYLIAAMDNNRAIGKKGGLAWWLPNDMAHFTKLTKESGCIIVGRTTFESCIKKPLEGRTNIVVGSCLHDGAFHANNLPAAIDLAAQFKFDHVFIIGGQKLYESALPFADAIYLTRVDTSILEPDVFFPNFESYFTLESSQFQEGRMPKYFSERFPPIKDPDLRFEKWVKNKT
jgi:dihydrofolate reductase